MNEQAAKNFVVRAANRTPAGIVSQIKLLTRRFQGFATMAGRQTVDSEAMRERLKNGAISIAKVKQEVKKMDSVGRYRAELALDRAGDNVMRGIYYVKQNKPHEAMQVLYEVALELNKAAKELQKLA